MMMEDFVKKVVPEIAQNIVNLTMERIEKMVKEIVPDLAEKAIQEEIRRLQKGRKGIQEEERLQRWPQRSWINLMTPTRSRRNGTAYWTEQSYFRADENSDASAYSIVIPPPNVTGVLHIGHALNNTLQDILIRFKRMEGYNALWMPGTDHAGIATQNVVEKQLAAEGLEPAYPGQGEIHRAGVEVEENSPGGRSSTS